MAGRSLIKIRACAKLNLGLRVLGRRRDGFHEVHTHLQSINLADEVEVRTRSDRKIVLEVRPPLRLPAEENLVHRAAELFLQETGIHLGVSIALTKKIPAGAGLGGGSSDAAAALVTLNELFETQIPPSTLAHWGAALGSDVPFFLTGGLACARGRGEVVTPLGPRFEGVHLVVLVPPVHASTTEVYRAWDELHPEEDFPEVTCHSLGLANELEAAACRRYPELKPWAELIRRAPTPIKGMSGSGSAFYAGFEDPSQAPAFFNKLKKERKTIKIFYCFPTTATLSDGQSAPVP